MLVQRGESASLDPRASLIGKRALRIDLREYWIVRDLPELSIVDDRSGNR